MKFTTWVKSLHGLKQFLLLVPEWSKATKDGKTSWSSRIMTEFRSILCPFLRQIISGNGLPSAIHFRLSVDPSTPETYDFYKKKYGNIVPKVRNNVSNMGNTVPNFGTLFSTLRILFSNWE